MEDTQYRGIYDQVKRNRKLLFFTAILLLATLLILFTVRNCNTTDPLVENSMEQEQVELGSDMDQLIFRIQNCSRLYTTEYQIHKIITHEDETQLNMVGLKLTLPMTDRHIAIPMDATLKAYVDLGGFTQQNIQTDGKYIQITLPDPHIELTSTLIDHDNTMSHNSFFSSKYTAKEQEALHRKGLNSIAQNILNSQILENARLSAARTLIPLITRMGYEEENIRINFSKESFDRADLSRLVDGNVLKIESPKE